MEDEVTIFGTLGDDNPLNGTNGNDVINAREGDDFVIAGQGDDELRGKDGNDALRGGQGDDRLIGGAGNDSFDAGTLSGATVSGGDDTWTGGGGADTFHFRPAVTGAQGDGSNHDRITDLNWGEGDRVVVGNATFSAQQALLDYIEGLQTSGDVDVYRAIQGGGSLVVKWDNDTSLTISAGATKANAKLYGWEMYDTLDEVFADAGNGDNTGASTNPDSVGWL